MLPCYNVLMFGKKSKTHRITALIIISGIILGVVLYLGYLGYQQYIFRRTQNIVPIIQPEYSTAPTEIPTPQNTPKIYYSVKYPGWFEYKSPPVNKDDWYSFILYYPEDWRLFENLRSESLSIQLKHNDGSIFDIIQGAGGAGRCRFPDDPDYDNPSGFERLGNNYIEIQKNSYQWRLSSSQVLNNYKLCQKYSGQWGDITSIGFTKIQINNKKTYNELVDILKRIEITEK